MTVNWSKARASVVGLPAIPQRASIVFDDPSIDRVNGSVPAPLARAKHIELHGRLAEGSTARPSGDRNRAADRARQRAGLHPLLAQPFDADIRTMLSGLKDFSPKPWPERFREIQAAGGQVEIVQSRIAAGRPDRGRRRHPRPQRQWPYRRRIADDGGRHREGYPGARHRKNAGGGRAAGDARPRRARRQIQDVTNLLGALDRPIPGLGKVVKQNANAGVAAGINALGKEAMLEGKKARAFPLRFVDGAVFFGPMKVGQVPPLF